MSLNGSMADFLVWLHRGTGSRRRKTNGLVFALENEVGHRQQRASIFGVAAIETRLCAARIVMRQRAHAIERTRFADERDQSLRLHRVEFLLFQNASDQFSC